MCTKKGWKYRRDYLKHLRREHPEKFYSDIAWGRNHKEGKFIPKSCALYLKVISKGKVGRPMKNKRGPKPKSKPKFKTIQENPYSDAGIFKRIWNEIKEPREIKEYCKYVKKTPARVGTAVPGLMTPSLPSGKQTTNFSSMDDFKKLRSRMLGKKK